MYVCVMFEPVCLCVRVRALVHKMAIMDGTGSFAVDAMVEGSRGEQ